MIREEDAYDPTYRGSFTYYFGTPYVNYVLIDPEARTCTEGKVHRSKMQEMLPLIGAADPRDVTKVPMDDDNKLTVMAMHDLWLLRAPRPDAAPFWYRPDHHEPALQYRGKALILAHNKAHDRLVSSRIVASQCDDFLIHWQEPAPAPHSFEWEKMIAPARAAAKELGESIEKMHEAAGGKMPGSISIENDARCFIAMLEIVAHHIESNPRPEDGGLWEREHGVLPLFSWVYKTLEEEGYLTDDLLSETARDWAHEYAY